MKKLATPAMGRWEFEKKKHGLTTIPPETRVLDHQP
jgi:hypothetical protein